MEVGLDRQQRQHSKQWFLLFIYLLIQEKFWLKKMRKEKKKTAETN